MKPADKVIMDMLKSLNDKYNVSYEESILSVLNNIDNKTEKYRMKKRFDRIVEHIKKLEDESND
jgi:hypothetical protein